MPAMWDVFGEKDEYGHWQKGIGQRWAKCRKVLRTDPNATPPKLKRSEFGSWDVTGTVLCDSAHVCPMCAFKRARHSSLQISACIAAHLAEPKPFEAPDVWLLSLTAPHSAADAYETSVTRLVRAWRYFAASGPYKRFCRSWGVAGVLRGWDSTIGRNGLHGHWHVALFPTLAYYAGQPIAGMPADDQRAIFQLIAEELRGAWETAVERAGFDLDGCRDAFRVQGLDLRNGRNSAEYFCKWGLAEEVALSTIKKGGRTHWDLLDAAAAGDEWAAARFREYGKATKGLAVVTGVKRLRDKLGVTDEYLEEHRAMLAERREKQAERDGEPIERVEPLSLDIRRELFRAALSLGWEQLTLFVDEAHARGDDPQLSLDQLLVAHERRRKRSARAGPEPPS